LISKLLAGPSESVHWKPVDYDGVTYRPVVVVYADEVVALGNTVREQEEYIQNLEDKLYPLILVGNQYRNSRAEDDAVAITNGEDIRVTVGDFRDLLEVLDPAYAKQRKINDDPDYAEFLRLKQKFEAAK
jgi:hypothetical protein